MSRRRDRELGMAQAINRRDVLHGFGALAASSFVPGVALAEQLLATESAGQVYYPPGLTGLRGNHDGSFEVAHALAREGKRDWGPVTAPDNSSYDLVVVGAGLSGLAAAHFFLKENPDATVLLLDNHDDFGGHAKRNEFQVDGKSIVCHGGSQGFVEPGGYPQTAKVLLDDLGVDMDRLADAYDVGFYERNGLTSCMHFDRRSWGVDRVLRFELGCLTYVPLASSDLTEAEFVAQMPMSDAARKEFLRLLTTKEYKLGMPPEQRDEYLFTTTYKDFITEYLDIREPEVFAVLQDLTLDMGAGIDAVSAGSALAYSGLPGADAAGLHDLPPDPPYVHHFPDGNASVARLIVRNLIPAAAPGSTIDDIVGARFDYQELDLPGSPVRLRLSSTAVRVQHDGPPEAAKSVHVDYVQHGKAQRVRAKHCVLACFNNIIPHLCPELPESQRQALSMGVRSPVLYTSVALRNWRAWKQIGIGAAVSSGSYHPILMLDFPVSFGGQEFPDNPDEPMIVHLERFPHFANHGLPPRQQRRMGRAELLTTTFETMERNVREQLASLLSAGDFDPARDIAGITVNRWAHGYSDGYYDIGDPWYPDDDERQPYIRGRKPFGRITIANSDAAGRAMLESAVLEGYRSVKEMK